MIKSTYDTTGVLIDPHTADAVKVARQFVQPDIPMLVLETALPAKFSETIEEALGHAAPSPLALADLESLPQHVEVMGYNEQAIRNQIETPRKCINQSFKDIKNIRKRKPRLCELRGFF